MHALRRFATVLATAALAGGVASPALAGDSVTVDASVEVTGPCLTTSTTYLDFGQQSLEGGAFRAITYQNCSAATERVYARGTDASGGGGGVDWLLDDSGTPCPDLGPNRFGVRTDAFLMIGTTDREIEEVSPGSDGAVGALGLFMPCAGSDGIGQTMTFQVVFTATF
jgi:hypothetical protein